MKINNLHILAALFMLCGSFSAEAQQPKNSPVANAPSAAIADGKTAFLKGEEENGLGNAEKAREYYQTAEKLLSNEVTASPQNAEVWYFLGYTTDRLSNTSGERLLDMERPTAQKISSYFEKVLKISPSYSGERYILSPVSKLTSTWGSLALAYAANGKLDSAEWALKEGKRAGGFIAPVLEFNRNILTSCDSNAILFVNGDNDTFPMLYVQLVEGFRQDVSVVNVSLLNTAWYPGLLKKRAPFSRAGVAMSLNDFTQLPEKLLKSHSDKIAITDAVLKEFNIDRDIVPNPDFAWTIDQQAPQDELLIENIFKTNNWKRPVYFSITSNPPPKMFENHLRHEALAYRITPEETSVGDPAPNITRLQAFAFPVAGEEGAYSFEGLADSTFMRDADAQNIAGTYYYPMYALAQYYVSGSDTNSLKRLMERMDEVLPDSRVPAPPAMLYAMAQIAAISGNKALFRDKISDVITILKNRVDAMKTTPLSETQEGGAAFYLLESYISAERFADANTFLDALVKKPSPNAYDVQIFAEIAKNRMRDMQKK